MSASQERRFKFHDVSKDIWVSGVLSRGQAYEPFETLWAQHLIRPGDVVLDVGAHIGYYTLLFSKLVGPGGTVLAFEPDPTNFVLLQENLALNGCSNVRAYNLALTESNQNVSLFLSSDNAGDHRIWHPEEDRPSVAVQGVALDEFWPLPSRHIDFVKLDVQGAEGAALRGMKSLLASQPKLTIMTEFWPYGLKHCGSSVSDLVAPLQQLGFAFYVIDEQNQRIASMVPEKLVTAFDSDPHVFINLLLLK